MKPKKKLLIFVVLILVAMGLFIFTRDRKAPQKDLPIEEMPQQVEQKILTFDLVNYAEDGMKKWQLKGDSADILAEIVNLTNIDMETYDEPKVTLTALKGAYDRENKEISLFEDVEALTSDGIRLTTDYLKWHGATDTITTDKPVRIERSDVVADGIGAKAFPQMKKMILNKDVIVRLEKSVIRDIDMSLKEEPQEDKDERPSKAIITCSGPLEIDYENNIAIFNDDVLVDDKKGKIYSDKMEAFLDPVSKNIVKVVAEGEVRVVQGKDSTYSQKAIYTTHDQKITLIGKPRIYIHTTEDIEKIEEELEGI